MKRLFYSIVLVLTSATSTMACPDYTAAADQTATYSADDLYVYGGGFGTIASGDFDLAACGQGQGFANRQPDVRFNVTGAGNNHTIIWAGPNSGNCNLVMLVRSANGSWFYNDDYQQGSNSPAIVLSGAAHINGTVNVWVGRRYSGHGCNTSISLSMQ